MLATEYRPTSWQDYCGNSGLVASIRSALDRAKRKGTGKAIWIQGPSGAGKTTLAHLCANHLSARSIDISEIDGDKADVDAVRKLDAYLQTPDMLRPLDCAGYWQIVIVNEAHACTDRAVQAFLTLLDRIPDRVLIVFTTTELSCFGKFEEPFMRRCLVYRLAGCCDQDAVARLLSIATKEEIPLSPAQAQALVDECAGNFGRAISRLESGDIPTSDGHTPTSAKPYVSLFSRAG